MKTYGIKVSEPGYDVNTAEDKNLSFKSDFTLLKVYKQGNATLSGSTWNSVSHSLSYIPQYLVFVKSSGSVYLATGYLGVLDLPVALAKMSTSTLYIYDTAGGGLTAFYYIFYEPVETGTAPSIVSTNKYGLKVSKNGVNVRTANILEQSFNSEKNSLKIIKDDVASSTASGSRTLNIAHNLGFIPGFMVFYEVDNSGYWLSLRTTEDLSGKNCLVDAYTDSTNLNITISTDSSATVKVHYYILADPGENV